MTFVVQIRCKPPTHFHHYEFSYENKNIVVVEVEASMGKDLLELGHTKKLEDHPDKEERIWAKKDE